MRKFWSWLYITVHVQQKYKHLARLTMLQVMSDSGFLDGMEAKGYPESKADHLLNRCVFVATLYAKAGKKKPLAHRKIPITVNFKILRKVLTYYINDEFDYLLK